MRIISLLPAATDIVAALGAAESLVGITHECDATPSARAQRVTQSAIDAHAEPGAVDRTVRETAQGGAPLFQLDADAIATLAPELIITQALCDVCAVSEGDVRKIARSLTPVPAILTLAATRLDDVLADVQRVANALGVEQQGHALTAKLVARMRRVHDTLKSARAPRPRVVVIEWTDPVYIAGHWVPEMIRRAGGLDAMAEPGAHSTVVSTESILRAAPEILFWAPCGYDASRAAEVAAAALTQREWSWARGLPSFALDANTLTSRPSPSLVTGIEVLAAVMHPSLFVPPSPDQARAVDTTSMTVR